MSRKRGTHTLKPKSTTDVHFGEISVSTVNDSDSDQAQRATPRGLTTRHKKTGVPHSVLKPWLNKGVPLIVVGSAILFLMVTPLGEYLQSTLTLHMVAQHILLIAAGFLITYGSDWLLLVGTRASTEISRAYTFLLRANSVLNRRGIISFAIAGLLTAYWHLPPNFDAAVIEESVHIEMHLSFVVVGSLIFIGSKLLTKRMRHIATIFAGKAMGLYGAFLLFAPSYVYSVYPFQEQPEAGLVMVVMMITMDLSVVPFWLYDYFGKSL